MSCYNDLVLFKRGLYKATHNSGGEEMKQRSQGSRRNAKNNRNATRQVARKPAPAKQLSRTQLAKLKAFAAINRVRKGEFRSLSAAARAEGTTVKTIRRLLPAALIPDRKGGRIRVKAGDPYSAPVEIVTDDGPVVAMARGSRERELAGQHRAIYMQVLGNKLPASALKQFRGKKVGGLELLSDFDRLSVLAKAGVLGQLTILYKSQGTGG
jgi:hypothetical protein